MIERVTKKFARYDGMLTFDIKSNTNVTFFDEMTVVTLRYKLTKFAADTIDGLKCGIKIVDNLGLARIVFNNFEHSTSISSMND